MMKTHSSCKSKMVTSARHIELIKISTKEIYLLTLKCTLSHICDAVPNFDFKLRRDNRKKIPMSAAPMSR